MIFKTEEGKSGHAHRKREALPWWIFGLLGLVLTVWLGHEFLDGPLGLAAESAAEIPTPAGIRTSAMSRLACSPGPSCDYFTPGDAGRPGLGWVFIGPVNAVLGWFFRGFNRQFDRMTAVYGRTVGKTLARQRGRAAGLRRPAGADVLAIQPHADGLHSAAGQGLPAAERAVARFRLGRAHARRSWPSIETLASRHAGRSSTRVGISGQSLILDANAPEPRLDVRHARRSSPSGAARTLTADAIAAALRDRCQRGGARGDRLGLRRAADRRPGHHRRLQADRRGPRQSRPGRAAARQRPDRRPGQQDTPGLQGLFNSSRANTPWLYLDIDRTKCMALGVPVSDVFNTLQVYLGSFYVNNFNEFGRTWQVNVQADQRFREHGRDIRQLQVRNNQGEMIRLGTLLDVRDISGPVMVMRYNMYSATAITGNTAPGTSSGQAIALMQEIASAGTAAVDGLRLDRADVPATAGRQRGDLSSSPWPWCSCSSCWPRSTRAGRCRWP